MKIMKKLGILMVCAMLVALITPESAKAYKTDAEILADSAHTALLEKYEENYAHNAKYKEPQCALYDINQDGVDELFVFYKKNYQLTYEIFYYDYSGEYGQVIRAKKLTNCDPIKYNKSKKQIEVVRSASYTETTTTIYSFTGKKLKKVVVYSLKSTNNGNRYYKNGKRISKRAHRKASLKTLKWKRVNDLA